MSDAVRWACTGEEKLRRREKVRGKCLERVLGKRDRSPPPASFEPKQVPFTGPLLEHRPNCRPRFRSKSPLLDPVVGDVLCAEDK